MIAMVVTLAAAGYVSFVFYQDKVERKFDKAASLCALCTTGKQVAQTNWDSRSEPPRTAQVSEEKQRGGKIRASTCQREAR